jgi:aspartyl aminopeptidase
MADRPEKADKEAEARRAFKDKARPRALDLIAYIDRGMTPYHAVKESERRLEQAGFQRLSERDVWALKAGSRAFVSRNGSSLIAFEVGRRSPALAGFKMIGAHTDSPNLKLKPRASYAKSGYRQVGVEVYGGVLYSTWLDRDLSIAGRVTARRGGQIETVLVDLAVPVCRIPNLAIHLNREVNSEGLKLNAQNHLPPIWALEGDAVSEDALFERIAQAAGVPAQDLLDHDLSLYDTQKGALSGFDDAFIQSPRLDNLASCHAAIGALLESAGSPGDGTRLIALYDHEEVGSQSAHGAQGPFLRSVLERILEAHPESAPQSFPRAIAASFLISSDMAHAIHPNYADRHEPQHSPVMGRGPVIKSNANQRYATDAESAAHFHALCKEAGFSPQSFVTRTDLGCGSTIGPITAAQLGVKTVDVGNPMLSMHSIREMAGAADTEMMHTVLSLFLRSA